MYREPGPAPHLILAQDNIVRAFRPDNGEVMWDVRLSGSGVPRLHIEGGHVYVIRGAMVFAIDYASGDQLWNTIIPGGGYGAPTTSVHERRVYVCHGSSLTALDTSTGNILWQTQIGVHRESCALGFPSNVTQSDDHGRS